MNWIWWLLQIISDWRWHPVQCVRSGMAGDLGWPDYDWWYSDGWAWRWQCRVVNNVWGARYYVRLRVPTAAVKPLTGQNPTEGMDRG